MAEFKTLREANLVRMDEWSGGKTMDLSFAGNELAGEVGEACNIMKKMERARLGMPTKPVTIAELAEELADVIICVDLIAMRFGLDMDEETKKKFNKTSEKMGLTTKYV